MFYKNPNAPVEQRVNDLPKRMTLDDKIAQMSMTLLNVIKLKKFRRRLEFQKNGIIMKNLKILLTVIIVLIICNFESNAQSQVIANSSFGEDYVSKLQIILCHPDDPLVVFAAEELQRYVRQLFEFQPSLFRGETGGNAATTILLGAEIDESLSEQGYMIRRIQHDGKPAMLITGGSARAILWAVYEVISNWGVHFLVQGDVFPEKAGSFHLPDLDIKREPVFPCREFRVVNDIPNTTVLWSLGQHKKLFDQLVKLRFTGIYIQTYPHQPWAHYEFQGIERDRGDLCYGWKHRIHEGTIGRELFGNVAYHTNPVFQGAETYEERLLCGQRFMRGIIAAAHERGLEVTFVHHLSDLPEEFIAKLPELSDAAGVVLPDEGISQEKFSRHGLTSIGGNPEAMRYCSPLNPVFVDLVETAFVAHIQAYPNAEKYGLTESEFPPGGAGVKACWDALDAKYNLEEKFSLEEILEKARKQFFYAEGRALAQAQGAIQTLRLLDILINERNVLQYATNPRAKIRGTFFSEHIQPLVEYVLPQEKFEFMSIVDYLPARVAERMHTLEFVKNGKTDVVMITTIEDDNVGFLPQLVTPSLHKTVQKMSEYGLQGFCFRQFDIAQHEPSMAYMIESAWDASIMPEDSYRRYALGVAGEKAVEDLLAAFHDVEDLTEVSNAMLGVAFLWPDLYKKYWQPGTKSDPGWQGYITQLVPIEDRLRMALSKSAQKGKHLVENYLNFIVFARQYVQALDLIRQARLAYDVAMEKRKTEDDFVYNPLIRKASDLLFEALAASETALKTWVKLVADPTDLGTLAGLNAYGHDWLRGKCTEVYWESQQYGKMLD